jgi:quercetin 2,3-dioxygenase
MMHVRTAQERGFADHGWLRSHHTFSFAGYDDPAHRGFRNLRVINEDRVAPGRGFGTHSHRDMEIVSYVLDGALEHKDSMGTGSVIRPGDVQRMTAGSGVAHSEFNASKVEPVHFLQIWLLPKAIGLRPGYEQKTFDAEEKRGQLRLVASPTATNGSLALAADALIYAGLFDGDERGVLEMAPGRHAWVQLIRGEANVNGEVLRAGDGARLSDVERVTIEHGKTAELLAFDLA